MRKLIALLTALVLLAAACGGDDSGSTATDGGGDNGSATTEAPTTTEGPQAGSIERVCITDAPGSGLNVDVPCASYHTAVSSENASLDMSEVFAVGHDQFACLYVPDQLLVFPALAGSVEEFGLEPLSAGELVDGMDGYLQAVGLGLYQITDGSDPFEKAGEVALDQGGSALASPHYLLAPTQGWKYGPADVKVPIGGEWKDLTMGSAVQGSKVVVIDTGGVSDSDKGQDAPALGVSFAAAEDGALPDHLKGHGQFIASIVNQYNPGLEVVIMNAGDEYGLVSELSVVAAYLAAGLKGVEVVNISLGTYPCTDDHPPLGLSVGTAVMPHELALALDPPSDEDLPKGVGVVAASGNDGEEIQVAMYPARLGMEGAPYLEAVLGPLGSGPITDSSNLAADIFLTFAGSLQESVTAVGALERPGGVDATWTAGIAAWSNPAEVYVPGEDVVGWSLPDQSLAVWSGTSFAAPLYAACLASGHCP